MTRTSSIGRYLAASATVAFVGYWILTLIPPIRQELLRYHPAGLGRSAVLFVFVGVAIALACRRPILTWRDNFRRFLLAVCLPLVVAPVFHVVRLIDWWAFDRKPAIEQLMTAESMTSIAIDLRNIGVVTVSFGLIVCVPLGMLSIYALQQLCEVESPRTEAI